jgi:hypothetical protein
MALWRRSEPALLGHRMIHGKPAQLGSPPLSKNNISGLNSRLFSAILCTVANVP